MQSDRGCLIDAWCELGGKALGGAFGFMFGVTLGALLGDALGQWSVPAANLNKNRAAGRRRCGRHWRTHMQCLMFPRNP